MKIWTRTALIFLLIATLIGTMLRWAFVGGTTWMNFKHFQHAHSHLAMLGWVFLMLYTFFIHSFLRPEQQVSRKYRNLFILQVISCVGMLISFPIQGYAPVSIGFSTIHILISYAFTWYFLRDLKQVQSPNSTALLFVKTALAFMILSTFALWAMGPIMASGMRGTALYYATVQFYLHFQFNGWFVFAALGLFFHLFELKGIRLPKTLVKQFYSLLVISCMMTYALAVAWSNPKPFVFWINSVGVVLQLVAIVYFLLILRKLFPDRKAVVKGKASFIIGLALACLILKILIQSAIVVPAIAEIAYTIRNFVVGFIHLVLLGVISIFILGYGHSRGLLQINNRLARMGLYVFLTAFVLTELLLFGQGLLLWASVGFIPFYYESIFICSALFPLGVFFLLLGQLSKPN